MGGILRRRGMMGDGANHLVYSLKNRTVQRGERISTGVYPLVSGRSVSILMDYTVAENPHSDNARWWKLIYCKNTSLGTKGICIGKQSADVASVSGYFDTNTNTILDMSVYPGRKRIVILHEADSNSLVFKTKDGNNGVVTKTLTGTFTESVNDQIYFGENASSSGLPQGEITLARIYDVIIPDDAINAFFA